MVLQRVEAEAPIEHGEAGGGEAHQSSGDDHDNAELISIVVDVCHIAAARLLRRRGEEGVARERERDDEHEQPEDAGKSSSFGEHLLALPPRSY